MQYIGAFLEYMQNFKMASKHTISAYKADLFQLDQYLSNSKISLYGISKSEIREFLSKLKDNEICPRSLARKISCYKSFCTYLINHNHAKEEDLAKILSLRRIKLPSRIPKSIPHDSICEMIEYIQSDACKIYKNNTDKIRDLAIIVLLYTSGMRISECLSIKKLDYISANEYITILGKGNKERIIPLIESTKKYIGEYLKVRTESEFLFSNSKGLQYSARIFQKNLEKIRKLMNLPEYLTPHALRHSCATELLKSGGQTRKIQELLGHSGLNTTQIYANVVD